MAIQSYRDLRVWQQSIDLVEAAYRSTAGMPANEVYGLVSQIKRAATSIPANIAEGYGRDSTGSYVHFLKIAKGSLRELETHFLVAARLGLLASDKLGPLLERAESIGKMLTALIKVLQNGKTTVETT